MMEEAAAPDKFEVDDRPTTPHISKLLSKSAGDLSEDVQILSVNRLTVEKIVLEKGGSREVLLTKSETTKKLCERTARLPTPKSRSSLWRKRSSSTDELLTAPKVQNFKIINNFDLSLVTDRSARGSKSIVLQGGSKLPISKTRNNEKRISPIKLTKNSSIGSLTRLNRPVKLSNLGKIRKTPPEVPPKPKKKNYPATSYVQPIIKPTVTSPLVEVSTNFSTNDQDTHNALEVKEKIYSQDLSDSKRNSIVGKTEASKAHEILERSQSKIERLQKNLRTQINLSTAQTYKQKLPGVSALRISTIANLDLNENIAKTTTFDKDFLERHNYDTQLKIEEKGLLETDIDNVSDIDRNDDASSSDKPRYSKKVLEVEKRWSGDFLVNNFEQNSSESSYVEELGSVSSRESIKTEATIKFSNHRNPSKYEGPGEHSRKQSIDEIFEETVSTVDSDSCFEDRIKAIDDDINDSVIADTTEDVESNDNSLSKKSTLRVLESAHDSKSDYSLDSDKRWDLTRNICDKIESKNQVINNSGDAETEKQNLAANVLENDDFCIANSDISKDYVIRNYSEHREESELAGTSSSPDGYASLIKEFTMEGTSSKTPKEEKKKKSGLRRLLPGIFSPKESRKEYKREQKERKKREERHFNQHQQNGIFTRSPDSMNLNEDITRNVKLDTSLNSSIIEERLNEIKQELFPEQGMTTSTPDHFLQNDRTVTQDPRSARSFTVNSSLSSIAPDDKWLDHNIISGSPDMRKFKQSLRNDTDRKCSLERKHSLQESNQPRFVRNHGPSGRISAPPSERFLIRPRAVHPVDRPLPAIPQKHEISNYENHEQIRKYPNYFRRQERIDSLKNYGTSSCRQVAGNDNYTNDPSLYENGNHIIEKAEINRNQSIDSGFNLTPVSAQVKITRQLIVNQNQKGTLIGRSPKYSPSSSHKSGDYADSSYTPNSSQKSEFSPGSSKSGEYYLNSPRNSCRTSPIDSCDERRDQSSLCDQQHLYRHCDGSQDQELAQNAPYPVSPKIRVQTKDEQVYDVAPISPLQEIRVDKVLPNPRHAIIQTNTDQDTFYSAQKSSPNIPLSTNLAKLRANVDTEGFQPASDEHLLNKNEGHTCSRMTSPIPSTRTLASPLQFRDSPTHREDREQRSSIQNLPRVMSPSRIQRITSPLTVLTPASPSPISTSITSPNSAANTNSSLLPANSRCMASPKNASQERDSTQEPQHRRQTNQSRTPLLSPNITQNRVTPSTESHTPISSFNSRRAQPNDQILIASPKREASMYESQSGRLNGAMESGCPDSPVPMAESPSQVMVPRTQRLRQNLYDSSKSQATENQSSRDEVRQARDIDQSVQRASPIIRSMSPPIDSRTTQKNIPRPEPIYLSRHAGQRALSPMTVQSDVRGGHNPIVSSGESQSNTLMVQERPENIRVHVPSSNQKQHEHGVHQMLGQSNCERPEETIYVARRVQSPSSNSRMHSQRPEVIYMQKDQSLLVPNVETKRALCPSLSTSSQSQQRFDVDPRRVHRVSEDIYGDCSRGRLRDSPVSEQLYGTRQHQRSPASPKPILEDGLRQNVHVIDQQNRGTPISSKSIQQQQNQQQICASKQKTLADNRQLIYESQQLDSGEVMYGQKQSLKQHEPIYGQRSSEPIYGHHTNRQMSPSKRQMLQHLEAFYWQQKALDAQRKSTDSPTLQIRAIDETKIESPEVREAIYWQQLKKLDEEQQRKIFENNQIEEKSDPLCCGKRLPCSNNSLPVGSQLRHGSNPSLVNQNLSVALPQEKQVSPNEQIHWQNKLLQSKSQIPVGKPPMIGQKGQNQPVLVVRPQQAVRGLDRTNQNINYDQRDGEIIRHDGLRSKSVSPHFTRGDERRSLSLPRKPELLNDDVRVNVKINRDVRTTNIANSHRKAITPPTYEVNDIEGIDTAKKPLAPPPIFKRGSLISNSSSSVEYGTMGTKRVSFSNQANSTEIGPGNWPTKHGMAPEPPTRKHRTEDRSPISSETNDSMYLQSSTDDQSSANNVYGNVGKPVSGQNEDEVTSFLGQREIVNETEYDAKPLPPPPHEISWMLKRSSSLKDSSGNPGRISRFEIQRAKVPANPRKWPGVSESESGSEAGEVQKILQRRNEEEWNPGGKGRQTNDAGGSGRAEGEGGSNDIGGSRRGGGGSGGVLGGGRGSGTSGSGGGGAGGRSRDEPRRHTLSGDHQPSLHHQQFNTPQLHPLHPHHLPPPHGQYGTPPNRHTTMDLEMGTKSRQRKSPLPRGYPPPSSTMLFDDDPGIMSEVETSSTGFRRGGKQRSSLPVVRTPSKTLERPLGQVFLQYRNETKRALLPNEITSIDTVKALFVRSFPKQLTMEYLDSPHVKVYIHDSNKNMFYELEDLRSHLRDIRDRSVLRLFESTDGVAGMPGPMGVPVGGAGLPAHWEDQSYFSEPEFDSEFQHQHIHKSKTSKNSTSGNSYYMGGSSTLPRGGSLMRAYSPATSSVVAGPNATPTQPKALGTPGGGGVAPAKPLRSYQCSKSPLGSLGGSARFSRDSSVSLYSIPDRLHGESGYMSSPERGGGVGTGSGRYPGGPYSTGSSYEEPYYSQYSGTVTPVIDEEASGWCSDTELLEESYSLYGVKPPGRPPSGPPRSPFPPGAPALPTGQPYDVTRIRVEQMERQLANLTGLVQKALTHAPLTSPSPRDYLQVPAGRDPYTRTTGAGDEFDKQSSSSSASLPDDSYLRTDVKPPKLGKDKSVSFEKSVSFSDEPPDMNSPKQHSPQHAADTKPTKPAIKSSTLPRMSSQERDRHKPTPPPKPVALAAGQYVYRDLALTPEMYNQLRGLQKKAKDLRQEVRNLRRMSQTQAHTVRETIRDTFITIRAMLLSGGEAAWAAGDTEKMRLNREEDLYKQEMIRLEKDLTELESTVEELRGNVINRKTRVNMSDVENMALILSKSSKTVADLKVRFPSLQEGMKGLLSSEMEKVVREEKFLKEEPERLESALRRCKKLTGTLVTLKRLASVQEQRSPNAASVDAEETPPITPTSAQHSKLTNTGQETVPNVKEPQMSTDL
ncbi:uncharacterized protein [Venturia canescens]|uniref:uncharacterized protein isoform X10 n=1 Tax=Venturia canescens TaxID=32260 RepID=UPI001C9D3AE4|nr:uncharacterized protein LOC122412823 isoform X10 [Venturia canescens]